jgi:hypothetical protein
MKIMLDLLHVCKGQGVLYQEQWGMPERNSTGLALLKLVLLSLHLEDMFLTML